jgi:2-isopropylmalate synthase
MRPHIIDCTLREGIQTKQCNFSIEQSVLLAKKISDFGVDMESEVDSWLLSKRDLDHQGAELSKHGK